MGVFIVWLLCQVIGRTFLIQLNKVRMNLIFIFQITLAIGFASSQSATSHDDSYDYYDDEGNPVTDRIVSDDAAEVAYYDYNTAPDQDQIPRGTCQASSRRRGRQLRRCRLIRNRCIRPTKPRFPPFSIFGCPCRCVGP